MNKYYTFGNVKCSVIEDSSGDDKDGQNQIERQFYGPATSCDELGLLGYTLNGFYIVKGKGQSSSSNKIEVVYCRFLRPHQQGTKEGI